MTHKQAARKLRTIQLRLEAMRGEITEIEREIPGWRSIIQNGPDSALRDAVNYCRDVGERMAKFETWTDWDRAEQAASDERKQIMAGTGVKL